MRRLKTRERCDRCSKWQEMGQLFTLPEALHPLLQAENEFCVCESCIQKYSIEQWKTWIEIARTKGNSFKNWNGK
jgi:hypothetical protein